MVKIVVIALLSFILGGTVVWRIWVNYENQRSGPVIHNAVVGMRDTQRKADINAYLQVLNEYTKDNQGKLPKAISENVKSIKKGEADICADFIPEYVRTLPHDPSIKVIGGIDDCNSPYDTGYTIVKNNDGTITMTAPMAEAETISITKNVRE